MQRPLNCLAALAVILLTAVPAFAHHSFAAEFDASKPITLKGTVSKLSWTNPHAWIYMDVKSPDGKTVNWAIQAAGPSALSSRGLTRQDLIPGAGLTVKGYLAKDGTSTAAGATATFPDGREFPIGATGPGPVIPLREIPPPPGNKTKPSPP